MSLLGHLATEEKHGMRLVYQLWQELLIADSSEDSSRGIGAAPKTDQLFTFLYGL
jgi:hypothetical protein